MSIGDPLQRERHEMPFVDAGDVRLRFVRTGQGEPCVLLHGGFGSHRTWIPICERLRAHFDVIAIDSRGQGCSSDGAGPITYGRMADDVVRVLDDLKIDRAHVIGYSDGGCIALHLLSDFPDRLATATLLGTPLHLTDYRDGALGVLGSLLDALAASGDAQPLEFAKEYRRLSPHPERWPQLVHKLGATWKTQPLFSDEMLALIDRPVLVIGVDHDEFLAREVFERTARLLPRSEIVWIEEATHAVPMTHPDRIADAFIGFVTSN